MRISDWSSDVCSSDLSGSQDCRLIRTAIHGHLTLGQCLNQYIVVERRQRSTRCNGLAKLSDEVHDRQYGADCGWIGHTVAGPDFRKHIFRRMAKFFKARQAEDTTTALYRLQKQENSAKPF